MRVVSVVVLFALVAVTFAAEKYTNKYDHIDLDKILSNERILDSYIKCMLDQGSCTPEGRELKKTTPDALTTDCAKCSESQKKNAERIIKHMREHKKEAWGKLVAKFDPEGKYEKRYQERMGKIL